MKQPLLALLAATTLSTTTAFAQEPTTPASIGLRLPTQKGSLMVGSNVLLGELAFGSTSDQYRMAGVYNVGLSPRVGYFIKDNLMLGAQLNANFFGDNFDKTYPGRGYNSQSVGLGVMARQYFGKAADKNGEQRKFRFFVEGGASYNTGWNHFSVREDSVMHGTFNSTTVHIMPGFNYFLNNNIAIEGGLNYSHVINSKNVIDNASNLRFNLGLQIFLNRKGR